MQHELKAVVVDDEVHCLETLTWQIETHCPEVKLVGSFRDPRKCLEFLEQNEVDILFLDIEMPVLNGLDLLKALSSRNFALVFTTAYDEFEMDALLHSAIDYLLKPIDGAELKRAVDRASVNKKFLSERLDDLFTRVNVNEKAELRFSTLNGELEVQPTEIVAIYRSADILVMRTVDRTIHQLTEGFFELLERLTDPAFVVIEEAGQVFNRGHVNGIKRGLNAFVVLRDGVEVAVSRAARQKVEAAIGNN